MKGVKYQVITWVPDPDKDPLATGNLCDEVPLYYVNSDRTYRPGEPDPVERRYGSGTVLMPVFTVGELIVVNSYGREINGLGRKADKWDVRYEEFRSFTKAILRAREVSFR